MHTQTHAKQAKGRALKGHPAEQRACPLLLLDFPARGLHKGGGEAHRHPSRDIHKNTGNHVQHDPKPRPEHLENTWTQKEKH
ncbi:uncharacterized protein VTP21DRAFT_539 [Calcarisporiella thermophila]|uniref:uncharacterized protein n=1 Tax=Calcarisporiella thermophila TaxID=911321 RepID=UPI0037444B91